MADKAHSLRLDGCLNLVDIQEHEPDTYPYLLHSAQTADPQLQGISRYSLLLIPQPLSPPLCNAQALARLQQLVLAADPSAQPGQSLPFSGGWFVYIGYEQASVFEPRLQLPPSPAPWCRWPTLYLHRCPQAVVVDHQEQCTWLISEDEGASLQALQHKLQALSNQRVSAVAVDVSVACTLQEDDPQLFLQGVATTQAYIQAGDVFQVNLSRAWRGLCQFSDTQLYRRLLGSNPAPFSAMARMPFGSIISSSPERLCQVHAGHINTRPIAGTRPVGGQPQLEREALRSHPKEAAEHLMLVDLERNDLGRIATPGSVQVAQFMQVESYAHVHHLVSSINARLPARRTAAEVLRALFPGGSITGCPKIRCMEIIAELEAEGRGAYTGSLGYIDHSGHMDLNILIRSMTLSQGQLMFRAGAGIVADSDAEQELEETRAKAAGLLRALEG